jgi:hypothetical protein
MRRRFVMAGRALAIYPPMVEARMAMGGGDRLVVEAPTITVAQNRLRP